MGVKFWRNDRINSDRKAPFRRLHLFGNDRWDSTLLDRFAKDTVGMLELANMHGNADFAHELGKAADEFRWINQATLWQRVRENFSSRLARHKYNNKPHPDGPDVRTIWDPASGREYFVEARGIASVIPFMRRGRFIPRWPAALNRALCQYSEVLPHDDIPGQFKRGAVSKEIPDQLRKNGRYLGVVTWDYPNQVGKLKVDEDGWQHFVEIPFDQQGTMMESRSRTRGGVREKQWRILGNSDETWYDRTADQVKDYVEEKSFNSTPKFTGAIYQLLETDMAKAYAVLRHVTDIADVKHELHHARERLEDSGRILGAAGYVLQGSWRGDQPVNPLQPGPVPPVPVGSGAPPAPAPDPAARRYSTGRGR